MKKKIGEILVSEGKISREQLGEALGRQAGEKTKLLGTILVEMGAATDETIARAISAQHGIEYVNPLAGTVDPHLLWKVPRPLAERYVLIPLERTNERLVSVAMAVPTDFNAIRDLEFLLRARIAPKVASATNIREAIHRLYGLAPDAQRLLSGHEPGKSTSSAPNPAVTTPNTIELDADEIKTQLQEGGAAPYIKLLNYLLFRAIDRRASDIHFEPESESLRVRFRIDGMLREVVRLPRWAEGPLVSRIKVVGELDVATHRKPQDGRVNATLAGRRIDLRIAVLPSQFGAKVVIRLLDPAMLETDLGVMGWQAGQLSTYYRMVAQPQGLVLVAGPTGSGKSTTLYGTLQRLRAETTSIVTVEDPIEYTIDGISQIQIDERAGITFPTSVRALLRHDPDVIVIGEIRDQATAAAATEAANTGHLVLSTLHTNNAIGTITRLLDLGIPPYLLASALTGVVAQRLIRRVCSDCAQIGSTEAEEWRRLNLSPREFGDMISRAGPGCQACQYAGYVGRVGVFEVLPISDAIRALIVERGSEQAFWAAARDEGLVTMLDDALHKVHLGISTMQEIARGVPVDPWRVDLIPRAVALAAAAKRTARAQAATSRTVGPASVRPPPPRADDAPGSRRGGASPSALPPPQVAAQNGAEPAPATPAPPPAELASPSYAPPAAPTLAPPPPQVSPSYDEWPPFVPHAAPGDGRPVVLVADDAPEILQLVSITLEDAYRIIVASDGVEALEAVARQKPDIVVLDVMMPRMTGYDVCAKLRASPDTETIPVLMLSARGERTHIMMGLSVGADDYLPKPFDPEELELRIRALLRRAGRLKEAPR